MSGVLLMTSQPKKNRFVYGKKRRTIFGIHKFRDFNSINSSNKSTYEDIPDSYHPISKKDFSGKFSACEGNPSTRISHLIHRFKPSKSSLRHNLKSISQGRSPEIYRDKNLISKSYVPNDKKEGGIRFLKIKEVSKSKSEELIPAAECSENVILGSSEKFTSYNVQSQSKGVPYNCYIQVTPLNTVKKRSFSTLFSENVSLEEISSVNSPVKNIRMSEGTSFKEINNEGDILKPQKKIVEIIIPIKTREVNTNIEISLTKLENLGNSRNSDSFADYFTPQTKILHENPSSLFISSPLNKPNLWVDISRKPSPITECFSKKNPKELKITSYKGLSKKNKELNIHNTQDRTHPKNVIIGISPRKKSSNPLKLFKHNENCLNSAKKTPQIHLLEKKPFYKKYSNGNISEKSKKSIIKDAKNNYLNIKKKNKYINSPLGIEIFKKTNNTFKKINNKLKTNISKNIVEQVGNRRKDSSKATGEYKTKKKGKSISMKQSLSFPLYIDITGSKNSERSNKSKLQSYKPKSAFEIVDIDSSFNNLSPLSKSNNNVSPQNISNKSDSWSIESGSLCSDDSILEDINYSVLNVIKDKNIDPPSTGPLIRSRALKNIAFTYGSRGLNGKKWCSNASSSEENYSNHIFNNRSSSMDDFPGIFDDDDLIWNNTLQNANSQLHQHFLVKNPDIPIESLISADHDRTSIKILNAFMERFALAQDTSADIRLYSKFLCKMKNTNFVKLSCSDINTLELFNIFSNSFQRSRVNYQSESLILVQSFTLIVFLTSVLSLNPKMCYDLVLEHRALERLVEIIILSEKSDFGTSIHLSKVLESSNSLCSYSSIINDVLHNLGIFNESFEPDLIYLCMSFSYRLTLESSPAALSMKGLIEKEMCASGTLSQLVDMIWNKFIPGYIVSYTRADNVCHFFGCDEPVPEKSSLDLSLIEVGLCILEYASQISSTFDFTSGGNVIGFGIGFDKNISVPLLSGLLSFCYNTLSAHFSHHLGRLTEGRTSSEGVTSKCMRSSSDLKHRIYKGCSANSQKTILRVNDIILSSLRIMMNILISPEISIDLMTKPDVFDSICCNLAHPDMLYIIKNSKQFEMNLEAAGDQGTNNLFGNHGFYKVLSLQYHDMFLLVVTMIERMCELSKHVPIIIKNPLISQNFGSPDAFDGTCKHSNSSSVILILCKAALILNDSEKKSGNDGHLNGPFVEIVSQKSPKYSSSDKNRFSYMNLSPVRNLGEEQVSLQLRNNFWCPSSPIAFVPSPMRNSGTDKRNGRKSDGNWESHTDLTFLLSTLNRLLVNLLSESPSDREFVAKELGQTQSFKLYNILNSTISD
ncbi:hypothetical protein AYI68_g5141 [Smittium mucronatum]|uniref:Uncharacterized protein n=1 Tax=Smittium mucronatum TaxID=133383 RepID=A0A1R0GV90_9FUNG|nr:hypothetical protein AYI68_g5141 [Smittium mucronatum]